MFFQLFSLFAFCMKLVITKDPKNKNTSNLFICITIVLFDFQSAFYTQNLYAGCFLDPLNIVIRRHLPILNSLYSKRKKMMLKGFLTRFPDFLSEKRRSHSAASRESAEQPTGALIKKKINKKKQQRKRGCKIKRNQKQNQKKKQRKIAPSKSQVD